MASSSVHPPETKGSAEIQYRPAPPGTPNDHLECGGRLLASLSVTFRHSGWQSDRHRVYRALLATQQTPARITAFANCGSHAYILASNTDPPRYRVAGSSCHDRFCHPCGTERASRIASNVISHAAGRRLRFITLTLIQYTEPLNNTLNRLYRSFRTLQRSPLWKKHVTGGVSFLELKYIHKTANWHPHLHILCEGSYFPQPLLRRQWLSVTGDSYIVDIRPGGNSRKVARYVTKYASKPMSSEFVRDPDLLSEAVQALYHRRLCTTFGGWRKVLLTDPDNDDEWTNLGDLHIWLQAAADGDAEALHVCNQINAKATEQALAIAKPRPPPTQPALSAFRERQHVLFDCSKLCF